MPKSVDGLRQRVVAVYTILLIANLAAWAAALLAFADHPVLLGTAAIAYGLGLRHAVDADHIAAIDNVTRRLMQLGRRPVGVGLFFSLGHSTVVVLASVAIAATTTAFGDWLDAFKDIGDVVGTFVSASFLLVVAGMNLVVLMGVYRSFRGIRSGVPYAAEDLALPLSGRGPVSRLLQPMFRLTSTSWHMFPLGFLFGLGFDTATEVGLLGISATQAANGLPIWSILVFPALFTAGMSLVDTTDGILMLGAYGWAFLNPVRKLYYNMAITSLSVVVAVLVGAIEIAGLAADKFKLSGHFSDVIGGLNDHFGTIGYLIITIFIRPSGQRR